MVLGMCCTIRKNFFKDLKIQQELARQKERKRNSWQKEQSVQRPCARGRQRLKQATWLEPEWQSETGKIKTERSAWTRSDTSLWNMAGSSFILGA